MVHGFGDIDARFVITNEASPSGHPCEGSLDHPSSREHLEAFLFLDAPDDFDGEVEEGGFIYQLPPIIGSVSEQVLHLGPPLSDGIEDCLRSGAVGNIGGAD